MTSSYNSIFLEEARILAHFSVTRQDNGYVGQINPPPPVRPTNERKKAQYQRPLPFGITNTQVLIDNVKFQAKFF